MTDYSQGAAYVDGAIVPIAQARMPVTDRGFLRSDATYDALHVWKGFIFRLQDHLDRFERNLAALRLVLPVERARLEEIIFDCVRRTGLRDAFIQIIGTRGIAERPSRDPRHFTNQLYVLVPPFVTI